MTEETQAPEEGEIDIRFVALVNLLAQMSAQLIENGRVTEARGLIDGLTALDAKTKGNLVEAESRMLESALYQLRMAVVTKKEEEGKGAEGAADGPGDADGTDDSGEPAGS